MFGARSDGDDFDRRAASNVSTAAESLKRLQTRREAERGPGWMPPRLEKSRRWTRHRMKNSAGGYWRNQYGNAQDVLARLQRQQGECLRGLSKPASVICPN